MSIKNREELETLLASNGFFVLEIDEKVEELKTVSNGITKFHTINVIAQRILNLT